MEISSYVPVVDRYRSIDEFAGSADRIHVRSLVVAGLLSLALWVLLFRLGHGLLTSLFLS